MRDNVTPFRPRKKPPKPKSSFNIASHRGRAVAVQALTAIAFVCNFYALPEATPFAPHFKYAPQVFYWVALAIGTGGAAIGATNRFSAMPWAATHHEHALRTILIGYSISTLLNLLVNFVLLPLRFLASVAAPIVLVSLIIQLAVLIWAEIRAIVGFVLAIMRRPIWHPRGWLL